MAAPKIAQLRKTSEADLIDAHDQEADKGQVGVAYYLDELARRGQARQSEEMLRLTRRIGWMTLVMTISTIVNVLIAFLRR